MHQSQGRREIPKLRQCLGSALPGALQQDTPVDASRLGWWGTAPGAEVAQRGACWRWTSAAGRDTIYRQSAL